MFMGDLYCERVLVYTNKFFLHDWALVPANPASKAEY